MDAHEILSAAAAAMSRKILTEGTEALDALDPAPLVTPWTARRTSSHTFARSTLEEEVLKHALPIKTAFLSDGTWNAVLATVRITRLLALAALFRRNASKPYEPSPIRDMLLEEIKHWYSELPQVFHLIDLAIASGRLARIYGGFAGIGSLCWMMLNYHGAMILLNSPSEEHVWSGKADSEWISSEAFLVAQEHAIRVTSMLSVVQSLATPVPEMTMPVSWFADTNVFEVSLTPYLSLVRRVSDRPHRLIHHTFIRLMSMNSNENNSMLAIAKQQLAVHTAALRKSGSVVPGTLPGRSWWFDVWVSMTGEA